MQSPERVAEDMLTWYRTVCGKVRVSVKRVSKSRAYLVWPIRLLLFCKDRPT